MLNSDRSRGEVGALRVSQGSDSALSWWRSLGVTESHQKRGWLLKTATLASWCVRSPRKDGGEYLGRHTLCAAILCKYEKSRLSEVLIHTSSAWFHVKKTPTKPSLQLPPLSLSGTTVRAIAFTICPSNYQFSFCLS